MFNNLVLNSIIEAETTGTDFRTDLKNELDLIKETMKCLEEMKKARQQLAVEEGFAHFKTIDVPVTTRKAYSYPRFYWNKD